jgi:hypothetical protein
LSISQTIVAAKQESRQLQLNNSCRSAPEKESGSDAVTDLWCKMVVFDVLYASTEEDDVAESKSDISTTTDIFTDVIPSLVTKYRSFTTP